MLHHWFIETKKNAMMLGNKARNVRMMLDTRMYQHFNTQKPKWQGTHVKDAIMGDVMIHAEIIFRMQLTSPAISTTSIPAHGLERERV